MQNKKINFLDEKDEIKREKYSIWASYYKFVENKSCIAFIEKSYYILKKYFINDKFYNEDIFLNSDILITIVIINLKSYISNINMICWNYFENSDYFINYCTNQFKFYCIIEGLGYDENESRKLFLIIFNILKENNLISFKSKKINDKKKFKTILFYSFEKIDYQISDDEMLNFTYCKQNTILHEGIYYSSTHHFSKINVIFKKNFYSGKRFILKDLNYLEKKMNVKVYIDSEFQDENKNVYNKQKIKKELKILKEELDKKYEDKYWTYNNNEEIAELQKKISKKLIEYNFCVFVEKKISYHIYFPLFFDFRGRKYYLSKLNPTSSKMLRTSFFYGYYKKRDFLENPSDLELTGENSLLIEKICFENNYDYSLMFFDSFYWCLIGIGKHFVSKENEKISEIEFLIKAREYLQKRNKIEKMEDFLEIKNYIKIMESLNMENYEKEKIKKRVIIKDATASVNQILVKKMDFKDKFSLKYLNLGNEKYWYNTYNVFKMLFLKTISNELKEEYEKILTRKLIKKLIMIIPYSAGFELCWKNYVEQVKEDNLEIEVNSKNKKKIKMFYKFVKEASQQYFYKIETSTYFDKILDSFEKNRQYEIQSDTGYADLSYYKLKRKTLEKKILINGVEKRISKQILIPTKSIDLDKFATSSGANIAHFLDGDEIRIIETIMKKYFITIHDCYLVDFLSCTKLIKTKQKHYEFTLKISNITTPFILL